MSLSTILAIAGVVLSAGVGAAWVFFGLGADFRAQRDLARLMAKPENQECLDELKEVRPKLLRKSPDQTDLQEAASVVQSLANRLSSPEKRAVRATLTEGWETNAAAYVFRLVEEADRLRGEA